MTKISTDRPQGSILAPSTFNMFINDLFLFIGTSTLCNYIDDNTIWDRVFKNGPSKIFKSCLPQTLLSPFLNALSHIFFRQKR